MKVLVELVVDVVVEAGTVEEAMKYAEGVIAQETQDLRLDDHKIKVGDMFAAVAADVETLTEEQREEIRSKYY